MKRSLAAISLVTFAILLLGQTAPQYPDWWFEKGVVGENAPPAPGEVGFDQTTWDAWVAANQPPLGPSDVGYDPQNQAHVDAWQEWSDANYAPAKLGQLKHIATQAKAYVDESAQPDAAEWDAAYAPYTNPFPLQSDAADHAPANIGQVKFIADGIYAILESYQFPIADDINNRLPAGSPTWTESRPWTAVTTDDENFAPVQLGQLKHVFAFDLTGHDFELPPVVDAGEDAELFLPPGSLQLAGSASDPDELPQALIVTWSKVSGTGNVTFDDANALDAIASFDASGVYVLRLTADDGLNAVTDDLEVTVIDDADENGIDDLIDTEWGAIASTWTDAIVNDAHDSFYDPDELVGSAADLLPIKPSDDYYVDSVLWDYDGDGISNLQEYRDGTDPKDFFNGETPVITIHWGNKQTVAPETFAPQSLYVKVENASGEGYLNAPVKYSVTGGYAGLARFQSNADLQSTLVVRAAANSATAYFYTPALASGEQDDFITVSTPLPNDTIVSITDENGDPDHFTITTDSGVPPPVDEPYNFRRTVNYDAQGAISSITFTWRFNTPTSNKNPSDIEFVIEEEQSDGSWVNILPATQTYANLAAPTDGNRYTYDMTSGFTSASANTRICNIHTTLIGGGSGGTPVTKPSNPTNPSSVDTDGDGLTDHDELYVWGTSPDVADTDGDGKDDGKEAVGYDPYFNFDAVPQSAYAIIDLGPVSTVGTPLSVNDRGTVVYDSSDPGFFSIQELGGQRIEITGVFEDLNNHDAYLYTSEDSKPMKAQLGHGDGEEITFPEFGGAYDDPDTGGTYYYHGVYIFEEPEILYEIQRITVWAEGVKAFSSFITDEDEVVSRVSAKFHWHDTELQFDFFVPDGVSIVDYDDPLVEDNGGDYFFGDFTTYATYVGGDILPGTDYTEADEGYVFRNGVINLDDSGSFLSEDFQYYNYFKLNLGKLEVSELLAVKRNGDFSTLTTEYGAQNSPEILNFSDGFSFDTEVFPTARYAQLARTEGQEGLWKIYPKNIDGYDIFSFTKPDEGGHILSATNGEKTKIYKVATNGLMLVSRLGQSSMRLWGIGRILEEEDILGPNSNWSNLSIKDLSDSGAFIAGTATNATTQQQHAIMLVPLSITADLNNDGELDSSDERLEADAEKQDATYADLERGKEYVLPNDEISNGAYESEDSDDDAERFLISVPGMDTGEVWLQYGTVRVGQNTNTIVGGDGNLKFYTDEDCSTPLKFPIDLSTDPFIEKTIFMRMVGEFINQIEHGLKLILKVGQTEIEDEVKLCIVSRFGHPNFFNAARDYIYERNTKYYYTYIDSYGSGHHYHLVTFLEDLATFRPWDMYDHDNNTPHGTGLADAVNLVPSADLITNGNFCDRDLFSVTRDCYGEFAYEGSNRVPPSIITGNPTSGYFGMNTSGNEYKFLRGQIASSADGAATPTDYGLGGLQTHDYSSTDYHDQEAGSIGRFVETDETLADYDKMLFVIMSEENDDGKNSSVVADARSSRIQTLSPTIGSDGDIAFYMLDGSTSVAMALRNPVGAPNENARTQLVAGSKQTGGFPFYCTNTYMIFQLETPRSVDP